MSFRRDGLLLTDGSHSPVSSLSRDPPPKPNRRRADCSQALRLGRFVFYTTGYATCALTTQVRVRADGQKRFQEFLRITDSLGIIDHRRMDEIVIIASESEWEGGREAWKFPICLESSGALGQHGRAARTFTRRQEDGLPRCPALDFPLYITVRFITVMGVTVNGGCHEIL